MMVSMMQGLEGSAVPNGQAFGVCRCDGGEHEDTPRCSVQSTDPQAMAITCQQGYTLQVRLRPKEIA